MVKWRARLEGSTGWAKVRRQEIARCISVGQCDDVSAFGLPNGMLRGGVQAGRQPGRVMGVCS